MTQSPETIILCVVVGFSDKLKIIMEKMKNISSPAKAADIAKMCRIGTSRSDVNRYLYYLKDKGKVCQTENKWSFQQEVSGNISPLIIAQPSNNNSLLLFINSFNSCCFNNICIQ